MSELETARRCSINTVTVVNNNGGLAQGITDIRAIYGERKGNIDLMLSYSNCGIVSWFK